MNNNLLVIIIFILILLIVINKDKLKINYFRGRKDITNDNIDRENDWLLDTNKESEAPEAPEEPDYSDAETDDTEVYTTDSPPNSPLDKYSKMLRSFSVGKNTESGVGKELELHTDDCNICMNPLNKSLCIQNKMYSQWEKTDFTENSPLFSEWDNAEEISKSDILSRPNPPGFGGDTTRVNRRFDKVIEYIDEPEEYAPDTLLRDDRYPPHLIPKLLRGADPSFL